MRDTERRILRRMKSLAEVQIGLESTDRALAAVRAALARRIDSQRQTRRLIMRFAMPAGIAAAFVTVVGLFFSVYPARPASAAEILAQAILAEAKVQTLHMKVSVRTIPHDNFHYIGLDCPMVPHEIWKEFGPPVRWRLEKPGRVMVVNDGELVALIRPNVAWKYKGTHGDIGWFGLLLEPDKTLEMERQAGLAHGWAMNVAQESTLNGVEQIVLTVEAKAQATYTNNYLRNSSIGDSDTRRVYRFDANSRLLTGVQIYVHGDAGDVLVAEVTQIEYNQPIDPSVFTIQLPQDVQWVEETKVLPDNARYEAMGPAETARAFFQACADENWDEVGKFWSPLTEDVKAYLGGMKIINVGEPFRSGLYPGWFVPYEIRLKNGENKKWNLAVRNDNPARRYVVDGGI